MRLVERFTTIFINVENIFQLHEWATAEDVAIYENSQRQHRTANGNANASNANGVAQQNSSFGAQFLENVIQSTLRKIPNKKLIF